MICGSLEATCLAGTKILVHASTENMFRIKREGINMLLLKGKNEKRSLILRTCSLLLAIMMIVSIAVPPVQAEDTGKQSVAENRRNEIGEQSVLEQLQTETERFTVESIQNAGVVDINFATAIYNSIIEDPNNFRKGLVLNMDAEIVEEGEVLTAEQIIEKGEAEGVTDRIKLILSYFTGIIEAESKEIEKIDGIKALRRARIINLRNNNISSLMPLKWGENYIFPTKPNEEQMRKYFGEYHLEKAKYRNTRIYIMGNPIREYPSKSDGCLKIDDNIETDMEILPERKFNLLIEDGGNGTITPNFLFNLKCDGTPIIIEDWGLEFRNNRGEENDLSFIDGYAAKALGPVAVQGIRKNQSFKIGIPGASFFKTYTAGIQDGLITARTTTFKWTQKFQIELYAELRVDKEIKRNIKIVKVDENNPEIVLPGAEFTLYDKDGKKLESKETDSKGEILFEGLEPGEYTVKETKPPLGYKENPSASKTFTISDDNSSFTAESKTGNRIQVYAGDVVEDGVVKETIEEKQIEDGVYVKCEDPLEKIDLSVIEGTQSRLRSFEVKWAGGDLEEEEKEQFASFDIEYDEENGSSNISEVLEEVEELVQEKTRDKYQNTEVKAVFENTDENNKPLVFTFANEPKLGNLEIRKRVENPEEMEFDESTEFEFKIDLVRGNSSLEGQYPYDIVGSTGAITESGQLESGDSIKLKKDEVVIIKNIPTKTQYCVEEMLTSDEKCYYDIKGKVREPKRDEKDNLLYDEQGNLLYSEKEVKGNVFEGETLGDTTVSVIAINKIVAYKLSVYKYDDTEQSRALENAEFTLYYEVSEGEESEKILMVDGEEKHVNKYQSGLTTLGGLLAETQEKINDPERKDIAFVTFNKLLPNTTWYLEETKVPSGHQIMKKILTVHVNENGVIEVKGKEEVNGEIKEGYLETSKVEGREDEFSITLTNKLNLIIPKAGMGGVYWYTVIGTLLIAAAAVAGAMAYRKNRNY